MRRWSAGLIIPLVTLALVGAPGPAGAVAFTRAGLTSHPSAPRTARPAGRPGVIRARGGDGSGRERRFGDVGFYGDDLGYGLAGGYVGAAGASDASTLDGAPPPGAFPRGPFPGFRPPFPAPCARPQIITIGRGVRGSDKVRVVYRAPPPCGP